MKAVFHLEHIHYGCTTKNIWYMSLKAQLKCNTNRWHVVLWKVLLVFCAVLRPYLVCANDWHWLSYWNAMLFSYFLCKLWVCILFFLLCLWSVFLFPLQISDKSLLHIYELYSVIIFVTQILFSQEIQQETPSALKPLCWCKSVCFSTPHCIIFLYLLWLNYGNEYCTYNPTMV